MLVEILPVTVDPLLGFDLVHELDEERVDDLGNQDLVIFQRVVIYKLGQKTPVLLDLATLHFAIISVELEDTEYLHLFHYI